MAAAEATHSAAKVARAMVALRIIAGELGQHSARRDRVCCDVETKPEKDMQPRSCKNKCLPRNSALADDLISARLRLRASFAAMLGSLSAVTTLCLALLPGSTLNPRHMQRVQARAVVVAEIVTPKMESSVGFDFVPLLTALQTGEFREADQLTRDGLITIAGEQAQKRGFVYFSEVPKLPKEDLATIERLWNTYSEGKFGYSVQAKAFNSKRVERRLSDLYDRIGWQREDIDGNGDEKSKKLLRWLPDAKSDEFIYDLEKAPVGHLPLTSTLRGTQLLTNLLDSDVWNNDEFKAE